MRKNGQYAHDDDETTKPLHSSRDTSYFEDIYAIKKIR